MRTSAELTIFKVQQAIGSMAIAGIRLSAQTQRNMLEIASGQTSASEVKQALIAQYKQKASA
ncbi:MAG: antitoxin VbhA family protein [Pseudomonadota bacterium]